MSVSQTKYVWGVKVYLAQAVTEDADIGMYVEQFGAASTRIDITKAGSVATYTWDGTGTDPNFSTNGMGIGDAVVINAAAFNAANNGTFYVTAVSDDAFSVTNAAVVAENDKLLGAVTAIKSAHQMRWIQNTVTTTKTWKQGILVDKAIGTIEQTADFTIGGNVAQVKGTSVTIKNIDGTNPLWDTLKDAGVRLIGKRVQIIEFDHSANPATETIIGTFIFDGAPRWNEGTFTLEAVPAYYKRNVLVGALVDNQPGGNYPNADAGDVGKLIPITCGEIRPDDNGPVGFSKAIRVSNYQNKWISASSAGYTDGYPVVDTYPIITVLSPNVYKIKSINSYSAVDVAIVKAELEGRYLYVMIDASNEGQYRKIITATCLANEIGFVIDQPFKSLLSTNSYVQMIDIDVVFKMDTFANYGPITELGADVVVQPSIYVYDSAYQNISESFFSVAVSSNDTELDVNPKRAITDITTINDATSVPFLSIFKYSYAYFVSASGRTLYKSKEGYYSNSIVVAAQTILTDTGTSADIIDRDGTTNTEYSISIPYEPRTLGATAEHAFVYRIQPPEIKSTDNFTKVYFGINANNGIGEVAAVPYTPYIDVFVEDWVGVISHLKTIELDTTAGTFDNTINNIPTWHYVSGAPADDTAYDTYINSEPTPVKDISGYPLFEIKIGGKSINVNNYKIISYVYFVMRFTNAGSGVADFTHTAKLYEGSFLFYRENTVSDAVYSPWRGRIFNDTWAGGRSGREKVAADMMESPIDIAEHFLRLQNWNDRDRNISWGSVYAPNALINTGTRIGGFDNAELDTLRTIKAARQILDEGDATTGAIVESLCKEFDLCSYQDNIGQECITSVIRSTVTPDVSLSLNDIIPGSISDIEEIGAADVFCEPYIQYAYNSATSKYDGIMRVTHSSADTFVSTYVSGYAGGDAELIWNMAHALYLRYGIITEPPAEITDLKWIRNSEDAKDRLLARLRYMGAYATGTGLQAAAASRKRFSFAVPYATATMIDAEHKPWFVSQQIDILLPHQTAGVSVRCIIESVRLDLYAGTAEITVICYDITSEMQYFIKDTYGASSTGVDDWKDTYQTQAEAATNGNDIVDTY